jgi:hypothetical protein
MNTSLFDRNEIKKFIMERANCEQLPPSGTAAQDLSLEAMTGEAMKKNVRSTNFNPDIKETTLREKVLYAISQRTKESDDAILSSMTLRIRELNSSFPEDSTHRQIVDEYCKVMKKEYAGEIELQHLSQILGSPIIVYTHRCLSSQSEGHLSATGANQPGLPAFFLLTGANERAAHYSTMIPAKLPSYMERLDQTRSLVHQNPWECTLLIDDVPMDFEVFNCHADGNCMFYAGELWRRGGFGITNDTLVMPLLKRPDILAQAKNRVLSVSADIDKELFQMWRCTPVSDYRQTIGTFNGGHAYAERSFSSCVHIFVLCNLLGLGINCPHVVVADLGLGSGMLPLAMGCLKTLKHPKAVCIGTEIDVKVYRAFLHIHERLLSKGFCRLASSRIDALDAGLLDGCTHTILFDGPTRPMDNIDFKHVDLLARNLSTSSIDVVSSTQMGTHKMIEEYARHSTEFRLSLPTPSLLCASIGLHTCQMKSSIQPNLCL